MCTIQKSLPWGDPPLPVTATLGKQEAHYHSADREMEAKRTGTPSARLGWD